MPPGPPAPVCRQPDDRDRGGQHDRNPRTRDVEIPVPSTDDVRRLIEVWRQAMAGQFDVATLKFDRDLRRMRIETYAQARRTELA